MYIMFMLIRRILLISFLLASTISASLVSTTITHAAACNPSDPVGNVSMTANIPDAGEYVVWVRMQVASPTDDVLRLEVNGDTCFRIGSASLPANTWVWVNYIGTSTTNIMKYTFQSAGEVPVKIFSKSYSVKVDKVLFLGSSESCASNGSTPEGDGSNCSSGPATDDGGDGDGGASGGTGSGGGSGSNQGGGSTQPTVTVPAIVAEDPESIESVEYYVDGELVQKSEGPEGFDTSVLENGEYSLTTKVRFKDGSTGETTENLVVSNPPVRFGGVRRWIYRNRTLIYIVSGTIGLSALSYAGYAGYRYVRHRRLYLTHHGLS